MADTNRIPAASPEAGEAAAVMSARHAWLRFRSEGHPLPSCLDDDPRPWQQHVLADHRVWYGPDAAPQVSGAFVLQYLLQVPAHTAAAAAGVGMRVSRLEDLTFEISRNGVPRLVEIGDLRRVGEAALDEALAVAERDYRAVAEPLAGAYVSTRPMSSQQRRGMVADMWAEAARAVRMGGGRFSVGEARRSSCCLIYALPGCVECAGCPRSARR
ncbi:MAG: (2Fe-2S)-binding protein [Dermatophilaceae bacterium]